MHGELKMDRSQFNESMIERDANGRRYWLYANLPKHTRDSLITEEELEKYGLEYCYLDSPETWSREAIDKIDDLLSLQMPAGAFEGALLDQDRYLLEKSLQKLQGKK